jgi:hypothetical protein
MNRARLRVLKDGSATGALGVLDDVFRSPPPGFTDLLERALSRGEVHAEAVGVARHICGMPSEAELYWQDDPDEEDENEADC